jgi:hypothetical protein
MSWFKAKFVPDEISGYLPRGYKRLNQNFGLAFTPGKQQAAVRS